MRSTRFYTQSYWPLVATGNFWEEMCWTLTYSDNISGSIVQMLLFSHVFGPQDLDPEIAASSRGMIKTPRSQPSTRALRAHPYLSRAMYHVVSIFHSIPYCKGMQGKPGGGYKYWGISSKALLVFFLPSPKLQFIPAVYQFLHVFTTFHLRLASFHILDHQRRVPGC